MAFEPTHRVGTAAATTWPSPDRSQAAGPDAAGLEVRVLDRQGDLAKVQCSNDWEAWVDNASLELITAGGPPSGPPADAWASQRPVWLIPAIVIAVVVVLIAVFAMQGDDDDRQTTASSSTTTAGPKLRVLSAASVLPSLATVESATGGEWTEDAEDRCAATGGTSDLTGGGDECSDADEFNYLCADESLEAPNTDTESRAETRMNQPGGGASLRLQSRVYETVAAAEDALAAVDIAFTGRCHSDEDSTTTMTPLAIDAVGDEHIAGTETEKEASTEAVPPTKHLWVRVDVVLVNFEVRDGPDLSDAELHDLGERAAAAVRTRLISQG